MRHGHGEAGAAIFLLSFLLSVGPRHSCNPVQRHIMSLSMVAGLVATLSLFSAPIALRRSSGLVREQLAELAGAPSVALAIYALFIFLLVPTARFVPLQCHPS